VNCMQLVIRVLLQSRTLWSLAFTRLYHRSSPYSARGDGGVPISLSSTHAPAKPETCGRHKKFQARPCRRPRRSSRQHDCELRSVNPGGGAAAPLVGQEAVLADSKRFGLRSMITS